MLRYSVEPGVSRENMSAVYALFGVVLIPISVPRDPDLAEHHPPRGLHPPRPADDEHRSSSPSACAGSRCSSLFATLYQLELAGKRLDPQLRELRELLTVA